MQICEIMRDNPLSVTELDTAEYAARMMAEHNVGVLPVIGHQSAGRLIGIVTDRDLVVRVMAVNRLPESTLIRDCMTKSPMACGVLDDVRYAMLLMQDRQVRGLPVVDVGNHLVGMITITDLIQHYTEADEVDRVLRSVSMRHSPTPA